MPPEKVYSLINGVFHVVKSLESEGGVKLKYRSTDEPNIDILYVFYASEIEPDINAFLNDIDALELNNKKIRPEKPEEKSQLQNVKLILQPNHKKSRAHQNEIILSSKADNSGKKIKEGNNSFDFIYYLAWLSKKGEPGIEPVQNITNSHLGNIIPEGHISKIFDKNNQYGRFDSGWAWIRGNEAQMNKMKSRINIKLKDKLGITFEIIIKEGIYYSINKNITVELKPYPT